MPAAIEYGSFVVLFVASFGESKELWLLFCLRGA
jgi:hypothetical protein